MKEWKMTKSVNERKMTIRTIFIGVLLLAAAFGAQRADAFGREGHGGQGGGWGRLEMLMHLDLTPEQKTQLREILPAYRAEIEGLRDALHVKRQQMQSLVAADHLDEAAVRQTFREMAPLMEEMAVLRGRLRHDIKAVLTSEQVAAVQDRRLNREKRRGDHRRMRESMLETWLNTPAGSTSAQ
jgi:Spy/CpxP family protein refolding chaperone